MTCACCGAGARLDAETGLCANCNGYGEVALAAARRVLALQDDAEDEAGYRALATQLRADGDESTEYYDALADLAAAFAATHSEAGAARAAGGGVSMMLPAYNPDARCPKCQHAAILTTYESGRRMFHCEVRNLFDDRECLHRTCERCRYGWHEACADVVLMVPVPAGSPPAAEEA